MFSITLANGLSGADAAKFSITVDTDGTVITEHDLSTKGGPITIAGFVHREPGDLDRPVDMERDTYVTWTDFVAAMPQVDGYRIVQRLTGGRVEISEFTVSDVQKG